MSCKTKLVISTTLFFGLSPKDLKRFCNQDGDGAIVKSVNVAEDAAGSAVVKVTLTNAAGTAFVIDNDVSLTAGLKEQVLTEPLIMEESEVLKVQATSGNVDVVASILEINREDR